VLPGKAKYKEHAFMVLFNTASAQPDVQPQAQPDVQPQAQPDVQPQAQPDAQPQAQADAQPQAQADVQPQAQADVQPQAQPDAQPQAQAATRTHRFARRALVRKGDLSTRVLNELVDQAGQYEVDVYKFVQSIVIAMTVVDSDHPDWVVNFIADLATKFPFSRKVLADRAAEWQKERMRQQWIDARVGLPEEFDIAFQRCQAVIERIREHMPAMSLNLMAFLALCANLPEQGVAYRNARQIIDIFKIEANTTADAVPAFEQMPDHWKVALGQDGKQSSD
jgi:hypothetical protein